ncbi:MAG: glycosyltransferase family 8 protein [Microthrixaceae bacterium]
MKLDLLIASDANYLPHAVTALTSVCEHNRHHGIVIHYLHPGLADAEAARVRSHFERYGAEVRFVEVDTARLGRYRTVFHFTTATYFRILCGDLLPRDVERVLYLDCDVVVRADVADICSADLGGGIVGAVRDAHLGDAPWKQKLNALTGANMQDYFNTGVLVIDVARYRDAGIGPAVLALLDRCHGDFFFADQDAFNVVLADRWHALPARWNVQSYWYAIDICIRSASYPPDWRLEYVNAIKNPAIVHYTTPSKPWQFMNAHPMKAEYWKYRRLTPYAE